MQRVHKMSRQHGVWLLAAALVTALSLLLVLAPSARADQAPPVAAGLQQSQIYNDDLEVERGQVLAGDVNVYSGDVVIRRDGRITGNLNVYSGDVEIEAGGRVDGNVTSWSGDVEIDGRVDGSVAAMAGDVEVGGAASVGGDISVMAGNIKQRAGAEVGGNILRGPEMNLPAPPAIGLLPWLGAQETQNAPFRGPNDGFLGDRPLGFVGRTLTGLLLLGLFVAGAAAIAAFRPRWTGEVQGTLASQAALSFAAGLIANVLMLAVIGFLYITICLRPPALLLAVGLLAFNVAGMAAVGAEIGGRLSERLRGTWTPTSRTALGVAAPGAIIVFLWAVGGCFGFFGNMGALLLGSFGVGAILVKALNLGAKAPTSPAAPTDSPAAPRAPATAPTTPSAPATSDSSSMPPVAPAAAAAPVATTLSETTPSAAASSDSSPLPPVAPAATVATDAAATAAAAAASEPAAPAAGTPSDTPPADTRAADVWAADAPASEAAAAAAPLGNAEPWWVDAGQLAGSAPAQEGSPAAPPAASPAAPAGSPAGPVAVDTDAALSAVAGMSAAGGQADFTGIEGIGPKLNQRLHAANIHTFADLASLPPETLAGILGWTSERLLRSGIVEQARRLA